MEESEDSEDASRAGPIAFPMRLTVAAADTRPPGEDTFFVDADIYELDVERREEDRILASMELELPSSE
jgi:hypothetical protein